MHLIKKYVFEPDFNNMVKAATNHWVDRIPLYEHIIDSKVMQEITGNSPHDLFFSKDMSESQEGFRQYWDFWRQMGYDTASMEFSICGALVGAGALYEHKEGCIKNREDFESYPWDEIPERFFDKYAPYIRNFEKTCPPGMKAVGGVGNGVFEAVQDIVGYTRLCYISVDDPKLYADLFKAVGNMMNDIWREFIYRYGDIYGVFRFGDDLGFKSNTLISSEDIKIHILPQYKRIVDLAHDSGKPFLLHSCGCIFDIMEDLIEMVGIDSKHSNEDQIARFSYWVDEYGDRIGNFGGIDTDILCTRSEEEIRDSVTEVISYCRNKGGFALGSGNSIPDYVPPEGYLAMIEWARELRNE